MSVDPDDLFTVCWAIQDDLKAAQAKMTTLRAFLSQLNLPEAKRPECPRCRVRCSSALDLLDHLAGVHDDPEAEKAREVEWARLEALAVHEAVA